MRNIACKGHVPAIGKPLQAKIRGIQQDLPLAVEIGNDLRNDGLRLIIQPRDIQRLPDMQRTQMTILVPTVPIVKAIGHVAGLLDLIEQDSLADGMHRTGGDIEDVA